MKSLRKRLIEKLDRIFSIFIRTRDNGICYTCGKVGEIRNMDAGHYISRTHYIHRWNELNVHCQCYACNKWKEGDRITYREHLVGDYGKCWVEDLEKTRFEEALFTIEDLQKKIEYYSDKYNKLTKC